VELLIGCGSNREKKIYANGKKEWDQLVTLDFNDDHEPDVIHDLEIFPYPFKDNAFDEIHAYEVLEHTGEQGDFRFFFKQWEEFYRVLKNGGLFFGTVPKWDSIWALGDPSHRRVLSHASLVFLDQEEYKKQIGKTPMSDFRFCYQGNFKVEYAKYQAEQFQFILKAVK